MIEPIEYILDATSRRKFVYILVLKVLTELFKNNDVLDKVLETEHIEIQTVLYNRWAEFQHWILPLQAYR